MKQFDAKSIEKTAKAWLQDVETASVFPTDIPTIVSYVQNNAKYTPKDIETLDSVAYGIFADAKSEASAVVKVIISKSGRRWIKMIDCHIRPSIEDSAIERVAGGFETIGEIYAAVITGSLKLTTEHKVNTVKVYGRSNALLQLITITAHFLEKSFAEQDLPFKVSIEGRWLVVVTK